MEILFLGLGRVNMALARVFQSEGSQDLWALDESQAGVKLLKCDGVDAQGQPQFSEKRLLKGSFDSLGADIFDAKQIFVSPGIDPRRPFFSKIEANEVRELDFFCSRFNGRIIAVTGTDGKSTFTFQLGEILKRHLPNKKIFVGGNLGNAMNLALLSSYDIAVLEVSSYQCERLKKTCLDAAIILNLDIDHLDRYHSLGDYHYAKWQLLRTAKRSFYPADQSPAVPCGVSSASYLNNESLQEILLKVGAVLSEDFQFEWNAELVKNLPRLPHRLQRFQDAGGRWIINDSKATTVHACIYALGILRREFPKLNLILGGVYKGDDFSRLKEFLRPEDRVIIYGEARHIIDRQIEFHSQRCLVESLAVALKTVSPKLTSGDCLLLSPACSSFDEFEDFEDRGRFFVEFFGLKLT